ncbi:MAG: hypothetical protein AB8I08_38840 [Sandaracinaceae bacterium]
MLLLVVALASGCCCDPSPLLSLLQRQTESVAERAAPAGPALARQPEPAFPTSATLLAPPVVPQARHLRALYDEAEANEAARIRHGVLICRVTVTGTGYDESFAGGADVAMQLTVGEGPPRPTTRQTPERIYSFPLHGIRPGLGLHVRVIDKDLFQDDLIGEGASVFRGGETQILTEGAEVRCRVAAGEDIEELRGFTLSSVRAAVESLSGREPDLHVSGFGVPGDEVHALRAAVYGALAWSSPDDPELLATLAPVDGLGAAWQARVDAAITQAATTGPAPGSPVMLSGVGRVSVSRLVCESEALNAIVALGDAIEPGPGCIATLTVEPESAGTMSLATTSLWAVGLGREGTEHVPRVRARGVGGRWLPQRPTPSATPHQAGEQRAWVLGFEPGRPELLRVVHRGSAVLLRTR